MLSPNIFAQSGSELEQVSFHGSGLRNQYLPSSDESMDEINDQKQPAGDFNTYEDDLPKLYLLSDEDNSAKLNFTLDSDFDDDYDDIDNDNDDEDASDQDERGVFHSALREAANFKRKPRNKTSKSGYLKRKMRRTRNDDPEIHHLLALGNKAYVEQEFEKAIGLFQEVIEKDPKNFAAYKTLGEIHREHGDIKKCCGLWMMAAMNNPTDVELWVTVAQLSAELNLTSQAIECYTKAISYNSKKDYKSVIERAKLYKLQQRYGRALEGFQKVLVAYPTNASILKELASVYVEQKRFNDAINLYMDVLHKNMSGLDDASTVPRFTWSELNILLELCLTQHLYNLGIQVLKLLARWIQDRESEKWWDDNDDDAEFDDRRAAVLASLPYSLQVEARNKPHNVPIDIQYKLGALRLGLNQRDEAMIHFNALRKEENVQDLFWDAGVLLESKGFYNEALQFLEQFNNPDIQLDEEAEQQLIPLLGKCYQEVGNYTKAMECFRRVSKWNPDDKENRLALAEVLYHLGDRESSKDILNAISAVEIHSQIPENHPNVPEDESDDTREDAIIQNRWKAKKVNKLTPQEKETMENLAKRKVLEKYHRMQRLELAMLQGDNLATSAWIQLASQLVDMFTNVRSFFPKDKNREFNGKAVYWRKNMDFDERLAHIHNLHEGISTDELLTRLVVQSMDEYRGLSFDTWFYIFMQYGLCLAAYEKNLDSAISVVNTASEASVFIQKKPKEMFLRLIQLKFGIASMEINGAVMTYIRYFLTTNQFSPFVYKFFMCCFPSGIEAWETFSNYNHQKFFLRQLKAFDSIQQGKSNYITGMATIVADTENVISRKEHAELLYVYANLLGGSRSYVSLIVYLNRAYKYYNKDPMICLVLGLAHVHRSMQRLSANRHLQLLQGVSYILEYGKLRASQLLDPYHSQEVDYNMGRLFHMLGLTTLAVQSYKKVLSYSVDDPDYDLLIDAAYNLSLIYNINGNGHLARLLTQRYLVI